VATASTTMEAATTAALEATTLEAASTMGGAGACSAYRPTH